MGPALLRLSQLPHQQLPREEPSLGAGGAARTDARRCCRPFASAACSSAALNTPSPLVSTALKLTSRFLINVARFGTVGAAGAGAEVAGTATVIAISAATGKAGLNTRSLPLEMDGVEICGHALAIRLGAVDRVNVDE